MPADLTMSKRMHARFESDRRQSQSASAGPPAQVRRIELARAAGAGAAPPALLEALLGAVALERVTRLRCGEGAVPAWGPGLLRRLVGLRSLNLSACGLTALPPGAPCSLQVRLTGCQIFRLSGY